MMLLLAASLARGASGVRPSVVETRGRVPEPRGCIPSSPSTARSARRETWPRSLTWPPASSARARRVGRAPRVSAARGAAAPPACGRWCSRRRKDWRCSTARISWPGSARSPCSTPARLARAGRRHRRHVARGADGHRTPRSTRASTRCGLTPGQHAAAANLRRADRGQRHHRVAPRLHARAGRLQPALHAAGARLGAGGRRLRAAAMLERELGAVSDNPLVFAADGVVLSGGNFHGEVLGLALDTLAMGLGPARRHQRAAHRPAGEPAHERGAAAVPVAAAAASTPAT